MVRNAEGSHGTHATLAHPTWSEILTYLKDKGHACAGQITEDLGIPDSTLSGQLTFRQPALRTWAWGVCGSVGGCVGGLMVGRGP